MQIRKIVISIFLFNHFSGMANSTGITRDGEFQNLRNSVEWKMKLYPDSAIIACQKLLILSQNSKSERKMAAAWSTMALLKIALSKYDEAYSFNKRSYLLNLQTNNRFELARNYSQFGTIYQNKAEYVNATRNFFLSNKLAKEKKMMQTLNYNYRCLSKISCLEQMSDKALKYAKLALDVEKQEPNRRSKALTFVSFADSYLVRGDLKKAEIFLSKAQLIFKSANQKYSEAHVLGLWAFIYAEKDISKMIKIMLQAQEVYDRVAPNSSYSATNIHNIAYAKGIISQHDTLFKQYQSTHSGISKKELIAESEVYYAKCIEVTRNTKNVKTYFDALGNLSQLLAFKGDYAGAFSNFKRWKNYESALFSQEKKNEIARLQANEEVLDLKIKNAKNTMINTILIASLLGLILLLVIVYRNYQAKKKLHKKEKLIQNQTITQLEQEKKLLSINAVFKGQEEERSRIAKDLHDGLGGLLSGTKLSFTHMKENLVLTSENAELFNNSLGMLDTTISDLRRISHNLMPESLAKFGLIDALKDFCNTLQTSTEIEINFQIFGNNRILENTVEIFIYRIIQELVNNSVKHARATEILVQISYLENKLIVVVEDNGCGYDQNNNRENGAGLKNIEYRVNYLNGTLETISSENNGTTNNIELHV